MATADDEMRELQRAARRYALAVAPDSCPDVVQVRDANRKVIVALTLPARDVPPAEGEEGPPPRLAPPAPLPPSPPSTGWVVTERGAWYNGRAVPVAASRVGLLKCLLEATGPAPASDLAARGWPPRHATTSEDNVRFHVRKLNEEIRTAFPGLTFDPVRGTGEGYVLGMG